MKKILFILSALSIILILPEMVFAASVPEPSGGLDLTNVIKGIASAMWKIFGLVAIVMFVVSGISFLTAQGEPEKLKKAKDSFIWGVAGVVVAILAYSIVAMVSSLF
ncbi:pilin [Patescibacteria group bacterium]|nr:pilin [Patescibacteria group bacterium]MBU4274212.1 pilin [Patescibacteria group bacterium]MBU4367308.1 pilin [Patescibacteria group bacterium]MBU4461645.1 pilin [Patescibacteria group bacterium]MCG2699695.1 pilin [Candidatus Parcubacteria bacterium]